MRRKIASLMRKVATTLLRDSSVDRVNINVRNLSKFMDKKIFELSKVDKSPLVGVVNGLAWTAVGGDVLKIEVIKIKGKGTIKLTGSMGGLVDWKGKVPGHPNLATFLLVWLKPFLNKN